MSRSTSRLSSSPMSLLAFALSLAPLAAIGLGYVRRRSAREAASRPLDIGAFVAAFSAAIAVVCVALEAYLQILPAGGWFDSANYARAAGNGAIVGATVFFTVRVLLLEGATSLYYWSLRRPREIARSLGEFVTTTAALLGGAAALFALFYGTLHVIGPHEAAWLLVPPLLALIPMYETFILPWIQYARAPTLASARLEELEAWIDRLRNERDLPRVRVRIQNGPFQNAFAIGGLGAHLIVIGKGLIDHLSLPHLQAVVAHEIAHVARRDVPWLLAPIAVGATLYSLLIARISGPLFSTGEIWGVASGALCAGVSYAACLMGIPGYFMRRMEFKADRLAAELLGNGEPLAQALERLCELSGQPLTKKTWSHPPMQARIEAIRSPAS